jgi:hypothetical protein
MFAPLNTFCFEKILSGGRYDYTSIRVSIFESGVMND